MSWRPKITEKSPRLFQNDVLEVLSRTPPSIVPIIYLPIVVYLLWYSISSGNVSYSVTFTLALFGAISWSIAEYWLHRVPMHWTPKKSWGPKLHFWVHGVHHELPDDPYRLVMPPAVSLALFFIFLGLFKLLFGHYVWAFQAGFTFGYIVYDMAHYYFHHTKPQFGWIKSIKRHHMLHHFNPRYEELNFSITVPFWDRVFGTSRPSDKLKAN